MKQSRKIQYLRLSLPIVVVCIVFVSVLIITTGIGNAAWLDVDLPSSLDNEEGIIYTETTSGTIYLPIVMRNYPWISPFGIESNRSLTDGSLLLERASDLGTNWVRMNSRISWRDLQPNPEDDLIDWSVLTSFENELLALKEQGMTPIVIIDDHPYWAVKPFYRNGESVYSSCAAIKTEKFMAFADFVRQIVERYGGPQYGVRNWELGNEPDVDPTLVQVDNIFGCWGDIDDPYYGGRHYGEMLKVVTPAIKAADPLAKVWIGGLLLNSPNNTNSGNGNPEKFLAGILESEAGPYFDILPYHAYFGYNGLMVDQDNAVVNSVWYPWGGIVLGKANYLRQVLTEYGINKPIFANELALNCPDYYPSCNPPADDFWQMQANQLVRSITRGLANQIMGFAWYTLDGPGWRNGALLDENQNQRPAYGAYQNLIMMLNNTKYLSSRDYGSEVDAYRFSRGNAYIDVLWAIEDQNITVSFPKSGLARNRDGAVLTPSEVDGNYHLLVGFSPIYIVFEP